jgi:outer membrane PBP1 activator LpoA protein
MQKDPDLEFSGNIGSLRLQANGTLLRDPAWAQFTGGQPVPYQWPAVD